MNNEDLKKKKCEYNPRPNVGYKKKKEFSLLHNNVKRIYNNV